jgi:tetratricopeptide (TPR) repeat protein
LPFKADTADQNNRLGYVDSEASYDILMTKCKWGNLASPDVYVDPESFRNVLAPKQNFMRLAKSLVAEGKNEQAVKVCDYVQQIFPDNKIHFDYYMVEFVNTYYAAGAFDKGNKLANRLLQIYEQNLEYISRLSPEFRGNYEEDHNIALSVLDYLKQMAAKYNQPAIIGQIEKYQNTTKSLN